MPERIQGKCMVFPQNPTASSKSYWELGSQDPPQFSGLTTPFTKIVVADQDEIDLFADVEISDKKVDGICLMFNNLSFYKSCKTHLLKLDDIGCCAQCGQIEKNDEKLDFRCSLVIHDSNGDSMVEIVIFLRHLNINLEKIQDETSLIEILEHSITMKMEMIIMLLLK